MKIYDISQEVFSCNVYPGDPVPEKEILYATEKPKKYLDGVPAVMGIRPMDMVFDDNGLVPGVITQAVFLCCFSAALFAIVLTLVLAVL